MPREIVTISIGQAGNQIGWRFWDMLTREHAAMSPPGVYDEGMSTFFQNVAAPGESSVPAGTGSFSRGKWAMGQEPLESLRARAVLIDTEEGVVNQVLRSSIGHLFDKSQLITDVSGAGNNWAHGYCVYGPEYRDAIFNQVRRALEACNSPQSFFLLHSLGGGTGSGLGSYVLEHLAEYYPELYRFVTSVFPSHEDDVITSPYNFMLACNKVVEYADCILPLENQALQDICGEVDAAIKKSSRGMLPSAVQSMYASSISYTEGNIMIRSRESEGNPYKYLAPSIAGAVDADVSTEPVGSAVMQELPDIIAAADDVLNRAIAISRQQPAAVRGSSLNRTASGTTSRSSPMVSRGRGAASASRRGTAPVSSGRGSTAIKVSDVETASSKLPSRTAVQTRVQPQEHASGPAVGASGGSESSLRSPDDNALDTRRGTAFDSMNNVAAHLLTHLTASMRFQGPLNVDLNEITSTLVPFPKLNFLQSSLGPLFTHPEAYSMSSSRYLDAMFVEAFSRGRQLLRGDPRKSIHLACGLLLRGDIVISDVARNVGKLKREIRMANWNPDGFKTGICAAKPLHGPYSLLTLSNNTSVVQTLQHSYEKFMSLYRVRAHMHHYTQYMEADEFREAVTQVMDVISSYNEMESAEDTLD